MVSMVLATLKSLNQKIFRINCLGASTTQNYLQFNNEVYSYPLELEKILKTKSHKNIEVNNCGSGGYTSSDILVRTLLQNLDTDPNVINFFITLIMILNLT